MAFGRSPIGALGISPNMVAKLPYNVEKDFQPVVVIARGHLAAVVAPNSEIKSIKDLIADAKKASFDLSLVNGEQVEA